MAAFALSAVVSTASAQTINLQWDWNAEPEVRGYVVYVGTRSRSYNQTFDVGNTDRFAFTQAQAGQTYYFAVRSYFAGPVLSEFSDEVSGVADAIPILTNPGNQVHQVGQQVTLQLEGRDPVGQPVTFDATGLPPGLLITRSIGRIDGVPTAAGVFNVVTSVSDGRQSTSQSFSWTIVAPPSPPGIPDDNDDQGDDAGRPAPGPSAPTPPPPSPDSGNPSPNPPETDPGSGAAPPPTTPPPATPPPATPPPAPGPSATPSADSGGTGDRIDDAIPPRSASRRPSSPDSLTGSVAVRTERRTTRDLPSSKRRSPAATTPQKSANTPAASAQAQPHAVARSVAADAQPATTAVPEGARARRTTSTNTAREMSDTLAVKVSEQPAPATGEVTTGTAPTLAIGTPSSRITVKAGQPVILTASARDAEDGDLSSRINWTSSVDGRVATGSSATAILSPGVHRLTATIVDSGNLSAQAVVVVTVVREP